MSGIRFFVAGRRNKDLVLYIPLMKDLMCGINAVEAQGCGCMFTFCHAYLKMGVLLHTMVIVCKRRAMTV